jgi:NADP-dependent 3-hydroxy acid dehydrogenase YdfG
MSRERLVLVTGASSGIGAAIARRLAAAGVNLIVLGRSRARLRAALRGIEGGGSIEPLTVDLAKPRDVARCVRKLRGGLSGLDGIVHVAGVFQMGPLAKASTASLSALVQVNVSAALALTTGLLPKLVKRAGSVIFINSTVVQRPNAGAPLYAATKHALRALADSLRDEVNRSGVRVSSVFPGRTATPMQAAILRAEGRKYRAAELIQPDDIALVVQQLLDLPATIEITEVFTRPARPPS